MPGALLHIKGDTISSYTPRLIFDEAHYNNSGEQGISFRGNDGGNEFSRISSYAFNSSRELRFWTATTGDVITQRMVIDGTGNVGIGSTVPGNKLDVFGGGVRSLVNSSYYSTFNYNAGTALSMNSSSAELSDNMQFIINGASASTTGNAFVFQTQTGNTTPATVMTINKSGNVGIGTIVPGTLVDVQTGSGRNIRFSDGNTRPTMTLINSSASAVLDLNSTRVALVNSTASGLSLATNNVDRLFIDSGGNVGIGTTVPNDILDIKAPSGDHSVRIDAPDTNSWTALSFYNSSGTRSGSIGYSGSTNTWPAAQRDAFFIGINGTSTVPLIFRTNDTERMRIDSSGNVGIGNTGPGAKLEVGSGASLPSINSETIALFDRTGSGGQNAYLSVMSGSSGNAGLLLGNSGSQSPGQIMYNNSINALTVSVNSAGAMTINSAGNVGIGTTIPAHKFQINGDAQSFSMKTATASTYMYQYLDNTDTNAYMGLESNGPAGVYSSSLADAVFLVNGGNFPLQLGTNGTARMTIAAGGSVGIGTFGPASLLDIFSATVPVLSLTSTSGGVNQLINFRAASHSQPIQAQIAGVDNGNYSDHITFSTKATSSGGTLSEKMRIQADGNVGIGVTNPMALLTVGNATRATSTYAPAFLVGNGSATSANINLSTGTNTNGTVISRLATINANNGNTGNQSSPNFYGITSIESVLSTATANASSDSGGHLTFWTKGDAGSLTERVRIQSDGNVGIGTMVPGKLLDINGSSAEVRILNTLSTYNPEVLYIAEPSFGGQYGLRFRYDPTQSGALGIYKVDNYVESALPIFSIQRGTQSVGIGTDMVGSSGKLIVLGGNVGIGTTNPGQLLDTYGPFPQIRAIANPSVSSAAGIKILPSTGNGNNGNPWTLYVGDGATPNTFFVNYNGSQLVSVKSDGNVGIGTSVPAGLLHAKQSSSGGTPYLGGGAPALVLEKSGTTTMQMLTGDGSDMRIWFGSPAATTAGALVYTTNATVANGSLDIYSGGQDRMTILGTGNVGIGSTAPAGKLDVSGGTGKVRLTDYTPSNRPAGSTSLMLQGFQQSWTQDNFDTNTNYFKIGGRFDDQNHGSSDWNAGYIALQVATLGGGNTHSTQLVFADNPNAFNNSSAPLIRMVIDQNGNVGIGTTVPGYKLEVVGTSKVSGVSDFGASTFINGRPLAATVTGLNTVGDVLLYKALSAIGDLSSIRFDGIHGPSGTQYTGPSIAATKETTAYQTALTFLTVNNSGGIAERMRIDGLGNVGIGTTVPAGKLEVSSIHGDVIFNVPTNTNALVSFRVAEVDKGYLFWNYNDAGSGVGTSMQLSNTQGKLLLGDSSGNGVVTLSSGNVGIGLTNPVERIDVNIF